MHKRILRVGLLLVLLCILFPPNAYAYLDPGAGSYIIQLLLAALVGAAFLIKVYWKKIKRLVARLVSAIAGTTSEEGKTNEER